MQSAPRIGVLTFHRCINYGSYWQARCLVEALREQGFDAVLLDHDCPQVRWAEWRCALQPSLPERTPRSLFRRYAAKARKTLAAVSALPLSRPFNLHAPHELEPFDAVIVGSDEVWNMRHPWYGGKGIFYGDGLPTQRLVAYAASFGNHDAAEGLHPWWADKLRSFSSIAVRDDNSRAMLEGALGEAPELVLDPCLLSPPPRPTHTAESVPYVAVYGHSFPGWFGDRVRAWARDKGYRLVSIGYHNDWADEQRIDASPAEFAALIGGSAAVATNFFHGCVFSLVNGRPFAAASSHYRSNKIRDLLSAVGAPTRLTNEDDGHSVFAQLLSEPPGQSVEQRIDDLRSRSRDYLAHALA